MQEGAGLLSYGGLNKFFGGLEAVVGVPSPRVHEAMMGEHTEREDSNLEFKTPNYGITTTSKSEWNFVADPLSASLHGWPSETIDVWYRPTSTAGEASNSPQRVKRVPMPLQQLMELMEVQNTRLRAMQEPELVLTEALGGRLYTGPLFVKYNAVLRGLDTDSDFLRCRFSYT